MKTKRNLILVTVLLSALLFSCKKESSEPVSENDLVSHSECKDGLKSGEYEDNQSCIKYNYNENTKRLIIEHINAGFNCCPGELSCSSDINNDIITITEKEESAQCNCNCLFDLNIEIKSVVKKKFTVIIAEPYRGEQAELKFEIDLNTEIEGEYCVIRNKYPWGIIN